jgi:hypothetical protein
LGPRAKGNKAWPWINYTYQIYCRKNRGCILNSQETHPASFMTQINCPYNEPQDYSFLFGPAPKLLVSHFDNKKLFWHSYTIKHLLIMITFCSFESVGLPMTGQTFEVWDTIITYATITVIIRFDNSVMTSRL